MEETYKPERDNPIIQKFKDTAKAQGRFLFLVQDGATRELTSDPEFWERLMWWWSTHADQEMETRLLDDTVQHPGGYKWVDALSEEQLADALSFAAGRTDHG